MLSPLCSHQKSSKSIIQEHKWACKDFFPQGRLHLRVYKTSFPRNAFLIVEFPETVTQWRVLLGGVCHWSGLFLPRPWSPWWWKLSTARWDPILLLCPSSVSHLLTTCLPGTFSAGSGMVFPHSLLVYLQCSEGRPCRLPGRVYQTEIEPPLSSYFKG